MSRVPQRQGERGSLKWIQRAVNDRPGLLNQLILEANPGLADIQWCSPLRADGYAEYRDADALELLGFDRLAGDLAAFWPNRGPQWDALGLAGDVVLLVEAKAHVAEMLSPPTQAGPESRVKIERALSKTAADLGARPLAPWTDAFYQLANRLAMLWFLSRQGVEARLVLVNFVGDTDMRGPEVAAERVAAMQVAQHVMGLPARHGLSNRIVSIYPEIAALA